MPAYVFDVAILLILAFFTWRGAKKGLILTLFSLLAVFVAWFGADFVSSNFSRPVANIIQPSIQVMLNEAVDDSLSGVVTEGSSPQGETARPETDASDPGSPASEEHSVSELMEIMERSEMFVGLRSYLEDAVREKTLEVTTTATEALSAYVARLIASAGLFGVTYLLIIFVWFLVSRALDLAFRLPILEPINLAGGAVFGFAKGVLLMLVVVWLAKVAGVLTEENTGPIAGMMTVERLSAILHTIVTGASSAA